MQQTFVTRLNFSALLSSAPHRLARAYGLRFAGTLLYLGVWTVVLHCALCHSMLPMLADTISTAISPLVAGYLIFVNSENSESQSRARRRATGSEFTNGVHSRTSGK